MAEPAQKCPKKGILKNSTSFDKNERKSSLKETKWDEMNIIATYHPADKDYGHMKIEEPKTPYNYACPEETDSMDGSLDTDALASKIRQGADQLPKAMEQVEEESEDDTNLTEEEKEERRLFEIKRKAHYNEFQAVKLARQLMAKEQDEEEEEESGAGPSSAPDQPADSAGAPHEPAASCSSG